MKTGKRASARAGRSSGEAVDWRLLPKGSSERKAAVSAQRRILAAAARARKAAKARSASTGPAVERTIVEAADEAVVGEAKLSYREMIEWVWEHLGEARCPPAPNRKARELWRYAKKNRDGFLDKYVPVLLRAEREPEEESSARETRREQRLTDEQLEGVRDWAEIVGLRRRNEPELEGKPSPA